MAYLDQHLTTNQTREIVSKVWGYEELVYNDHHYCGKFLHYNGKAASSLHYHMVKDEVLMVLKGVMQVELIPNYGKADKEQYVMSENAQDAIHLVPGTAHRLTPVGECVVIEWSTADNLYDTVRLEESKLL